MAWEYLKHRDNILREQYMKEQEEFMDTINQEFFEKEGFYEQVVYPALDNAVKENCFVSYKIKEDRDDRKEIILIFPETHEYMVNDYVLKIENQGCYKITLMHVESQLEEYKESINIVTEFYGKPNAVDLFSALIDELFEMLDRQCNRD